jgi:CRP-like cAMP-binding protein
MTVHALAEIQKAPIFRDRLDDDDKAVVESLGWKLKSYPQNALVGHRGDGRRIFMIHSGWACLYSTLPDGERQILDFPLKGDVIAPRVCETGASELLIAHTELRVFEAPANAVAIGFARSPRLGGALLAALERHRAILIEHFTSVGRRRAIIRVAHFLLELAVRLEKAGVGKHDGYKCPLTQYDLADALGMTAIYVNRMLRELREKEFVEFRQGSVRFLNRHALEKFAGFDAGHLD